MSGISSASHFVDGLQFPSMFSVDAFRSAVNYKPRDDDVFVVTYPKCGSTWSLHLVTLILRGAEPFDSKWTYVRDAPHIETTGAEAIAKMAGPGCIKSHLPFRLIPWSEKAKYIYVTRNPKDTCVSYFYHTRGVPGHQFSGTFDEYFELFINGNVDFGDYFDHLLSWYEHRNDPNVLLITYEEMKENLKDSILRIASFIDHEKYAAPLIKDRSKLDFLVEYCSFDKLKHVINKEWTDFFSMTPEQAMASDIPQSLKEVFARCVTTPGKRAQEPFSICRKGVIGDWRGHFSEEQSQRMDEKCAKKLKGTGAVNLWKKYL